MSSFEDEFKRAANDALKEKAKEFEREMKRLGARYRGRPVSEIKRAVRRAIPGLTDRQATQYAQDISDGARLRFRAQPLR